MVDGRKVVFSYGWEEADQEYLKKVVEKYPEIFYLENQQKEGEFNLLKIKDDGFEKLTLKLLMDVVDNDNSDWFELVDVEKGTLLNSRKVNEPSVSFSTHNS